MGINTRSFKPIDWAVLVTGVVVLVALFLPWWGVSFGGFSASVSGWQTSYGWLGGLLVVVAAAWYMLSRGGVAMPDVRVSKLSASLIGTSAGLLIILIRWITLPRGGYLGRTFNYGGRAGIWLAAIAAAVQLGVLFAAFRQSGEPLPWKSSGQGGYPR